MGRVPALRCAGGDPSTAAPESAASPRRGAKSWPCGRREGLIRPTWLKLLPPLRDRGRDRNVRAVAARRSLHLSTRAPHRVPERCWKPQGPRGPRGPVPGLVDSDAPPGASVPPSLGFGAGDTTGNTYRRDLPDPDARAFLTRETWLATRMPPLSLPECPQTPTRMPPKTPPSLPECPQAHPNYTRSIELRRGDLRAAREQDEELLR